MAFKLGELVVVALNEQHAASKEMGMGANHRLGVVVGHPKPVTHEGYPFEVLVDGQVVRVFREHLKRFDFMKMQDQRK